MTAMANGETPSTGRALPAPDDPAAASRCATALRKFSAIRVPYGPQNAVAARISVLHQRSLGGRGKPMKGLSLSQVSQAGKSFLLQCCRNDIMAQSELLNGRPNPHQVLYLGLEVRITVTMMCRHLLRLLGDPHYRKGNTDDVKLRTRELMEARGVELLIIDEAQHLVRETNQNADVTDELKRFLDAGIVPVVMAGNEESRELFVRNTQLASRLGVPLELSPVDARQGGQKSDFKTFCHDLDARMFACGCTRTLSGFTASAQISGLLRASGGHIGRVCRIVEAALEQASLRDADFVELYDLAFAVDSFAIPQRYTAVNPFRRV